MGRLLPLLLALLAVPASQATRQGGHPIALVTAERQNQLLVVGLANRQIEKRLRMPADPQNVEANDRVAVIVSTRAHAVTLVDVRRLAVTRVFRGFSSPHIAELSPDGQFAYVTDDARGELVTIGLGRKRILDRLFVGRGAHHMAFRPRHRELWIAVGEHAPSIHIVDTTDAAHPRARGWFSPPDGSTIHDLAFPAGGRRLWVTSADGLRVRVYDARTRGLLFTRDAGSPPQHVLASRYVYVTSGNDARLRIFSVGGRLLREVAVPEGSYNLTSGWGVVLTSSLANGTLTELRSNGGVVFSRRVAPAARDIAVAVVP